jgi:hypothetical protein
VHGISGNYYLDKATGRELMITGPLLVSSGTVLVAHLGRDQLSSNSASENHRRDNLRTGETNLLLLVQPLSMLCASSSPN